MRFDKFFASFRCCYNSNINPQETSNISSSTEDISTEVVDRNDIVADDDSACEFGVKECIYALKNITEHLEKYVKSDIKSSDVNETVTIKDILILTEILEEVDVMLDKKNTHTNLFPKYVDSHLVEPLFESTYNLYKNMKVQEKIQDRKKFFINLCKNCVKNEMKSLLNFKCKKFSKSFENLKTKILFSPEDLQEIACETNKTSESTSKNPIEHLKLQFSLDFNALIERRTLIMKLKHAIKNIVKECLQPAFKILAIKDYSRNFETLQDKDPNDSSNLKNELLKFLHKNLGNFIDSDAETDGIILTSTDLLINMNNTLKELNQDNLNKNYNASYNKLKILIDNLKTEKDGIIIQSLTDLIDEASIVYHEFELIEKLYDDFCRFREKIKVPFLQFYEIQKVKKSIVELKLLVINKLNTDNVEQSHIKELNCISILFPIRSQLQLYANKYESDLKSGSFSKFLIRLCSLLSQFLESDVEKMDGIKYSKQNLESAILACNIRKRYELIRKKITQITVDIQNILNDDPFHEKYIEIIESIGPKSNFRFILKLFNKFCVFDRLENNADKNFEKDMLEIDEAILYIKN
ncbi:hypothetical protein EDEG_01050 [Edhazardia aedis USNM 41457]|uniref:Uncharacterized protein n=1 Tax=Edhazardia aedis (strain USNM 41457) TaxID=1003232 RepID=J9DQC9_EDHAE|nr:hypothetical protein EDEG_01050 [Edhazardia aedis USNM 41457]|eukprot:EJW04760.1 hypothetical protein EDEG_01050 [Edhazardia aedis USNM 41457]